MKNFSVSVAKGQCKVREDGEFFGSTNFGEIPRVDSVEVLCDIRGLNFFVSKGSCSCTTENSFGSLRSSLSRGSSSLARPNFGARQRFALQKGNSFHWGLISYLSDF